MTAVYPSAVLLCDFFDVPRQSEAYERGLCNGVKMMSMIVGALALLTASQSPPIRCEITMRSWCIIQLPSTVEMTDDGRSREWKIILRKDVARAEIRIHEDKFCDGELRLQEETRTRDTFEIVSQSGCGLAVVVSNYGPGIVPKTLLQKILLLRKHTAGDLLR